MIYKIGSNKSGHMAAWPLRIDYLDPRVNETMRYALIGGLISILSTIALYRLSGLGNRFVFNGVFVGGLVAGWLADGSVATVGRSGFLAGVIGGLPGPWMLFDGASAITGLQRQFTLNEVVNTLEPATIVLALFAASGFVGFLGAIGGSMLAGPFDDRASGQSTADGGSR